MSVSRCLKMWPSENVLSATIQPTRTQQPQQATKSTFPLSAKKSQAPTDNPYLCAWTHLVSCSQERCQEKMVGSDGDSVAS